MERRRAIRATWGGVRAWQNVRQEVVFVVGLNRNAAEDSQALKEEQLLYGDILQFNMTDDAM